MTLQEFNNLKKGDKLYYILPTSDIYEYKILKKSGNNLKTIITRTKINYSFDYKDILRLGYFTFDHLLENLKLLDKDKLVQIINNKSNNNIIQMFQYEFVEYLI